MHPSRRMQPLFSISLLCLACHAGVAQEPDETPAPLDAAARAEALEQRATLERTIANLETQHGIYGEELSEAYLELGRTQRALGEHDAAADAFNKSLQALRVSNGLNDIRQLPVLQELRATEEELGDWDEVHAMHYLAFNIAMRNDDEDLREITRLEEKEAYAGRNLHLASLYLDLASTELSEAKRKYELPITEFQTPGLGEQRSTVEQTCFTTIDRNGRPITVCNQPMVVPNMNYYLAPNAQKAQEIRSHLLDVESTVLKAFNVLQDHIDPSARQTELLDEMHRLTGEYNAFVQENRDQQTTLR